MFDVKILWLLIILILAGYSLMISLALLKGYKETETFHPFEGLLIMCTLFVLSVGAWMNGYKEGLKGGDKDT